MVHCISRSAFCMRWKRQFLYCMKLIGQSAARWTKAIGPKFPQPNEIVELYRCVDVHTLVSSPSVSTGQDTCQARVGCPHGRSERL